MFDHLEAFPIKLRLLHEQVGNRGFEIEVDDLFPPGTSNLVVFGGDEDLQVGTRAVGRAAQASVNNFLRVNPRVLVGNVLESKIRCFVLDRQDGGG